MKTKFYWVAFLASAAMIAQANAGGHHGGGGGSFAGSAYAGGAGHYASGPRFSGGRTFYSGQRFSAYGMRQYPSAFRPNYAGSNRVGVNRAFNGTRQVSRASQFGNRNNLPANWHNHVVAQHSANWHRDWDRGRDHFWHGHHYRFVNGAWFAFDFGFDPWWPYDYPYDYYGYNAYDYPYGYAPGYYDSENYQGQGYENSNEGNYGSYDQSAGSTVAVVQAQLARQGYYRGQIDGVLGGQTQRAIANYQNDHGLRVTGSLTTDTLRTLGLHRVASN